MVKKRGRYWPSNEGNDYNCGKMKGQKTFVL